MEKLKTSGLSREEIIEAFRLVLETRIVDDRYWQLTLSLIHI